MTPSDASDTPLQSRPRIAPDPNAPPPRDPLTRREQMARVGLAAAAAFVSVNIWTGGPLFALWVGSRAVPSSGLSMGAVFLVIAVLLGSVIGLATLLTRINDRYNRLSGRPEPERRTSPWLRSMRSEREEFAKQRQGVNAIERVVVASVMLAALAFNVWFFFLAGSSIG